MNLVFLAAALAGPAAAVVDTGGAADVFREAKTICVRDNGALWGRSLCGPILIVDPTDSAIVANQADAQGVLKPAGTVYTGTLPPSEILANTSVEWSGTMWSELLWPLPEDMNHRHVMLAHEMFHRIQPDLGIVRSDGDNRHLDTLEGRYLLQLEWRALAAALTARGDTARNIAVADALLFRRERERLFPGSAAQEWALESNEGVAEYTGVRLGLTTAGDRTAYAVSDLSAFVAAPTFVRSFAYATGPAYGLLLDRADPACLGKLKTAQGFGQLLATALSLPPSHAAVAERAAHYGGAELRASEVKRDADGRARLAALKAKLVDGPVLRLPLGKFGYQFNPQTLQPLGDLGTVYPTMRLTDAWGTIDVENGAFLDKAQKSLTVSAAGIDPSNLKGDGWRLTLKDGWRVRAGARPGDFTVARAEDAGR